MKRTTVVKVGRYLDGERLEAYEAEIFDETTDGHVERLEAR